MDQGKHYLYFGNEKIYKDFCNVYITHFNNNGPKLYRCLRKLQVIEDEERQLEIIKNYHEGKTNHRGINETVKQLQQRYYWLNMKNIVTTYIKKCEQCNRNKYDRQAPHPELNITEKVDQPFQRIHMDTFVIGGQIYLTCVDAFTKFAQAIPIRSKNAIELAEAIITYFSSYGVPAEIVMDGGTEFTNELVRELLEKHKVSTHITTPYNPNSNRDRVQENKTKIIEKRNTSLKTQPLEIGQQVYVKQLIGYKSKINPRFSGPYNVKKIFENGAAIVIDKNKRERKVHVRNLKYGVVTDSSPGSQDQPGTSNYGVVTDSSPGSQDQPGTSN
ncbi:Integrase zinc binding domain [Popillia japonica]|uniref:RNA-directed DNA polymerase n=1 Tax=Popillia japonica TaxID=7064 RepID=A0AAW1N0T8_POPJA